jgi:hypothetical protein
MKVHEMKRCCSLQTITAILFRGQRDRTSFYELLLPYGSKGKAIATAAIATRENPQVSLTLIKNE